MNEYELLDILEQITPAQFAKLVFILKVPKNLMPGKDTEQTIKAIALIEWAKAPGGCGLRIINQSLRLMKIDISDKPTEKLPKPCNFNLTKLIPKCIDQLLSLDSEQRLIGFAIPCDDDLFLDNFCERLKEEYYRQKTVIKETLPLSPKYNSVSTAIKTIKRYKNLLKTFNLICPIRVSVFGESENSAQISDTFWQSLGDEFKYSSSNHLIVIFTGGEDSVFPDQTKYNNIYQLGTPVFIQADIFRWINQIINKLDWPDPMIDQWRELMIAECSNGNLLEIRWVYEHLSYSLQLLQKNPSAESFLEELEQRRQLYA